MGNAVADILQLPLAARIEAVEAICLLQPIRLEPNCPCPISVYQRAAKEFC